MCLVRRPHVCQLETMTEALVTAATVTVRGGGGVRRAGD